jgi:hypothetical protein
VLGPLLEGRRVRLEPTLREHLPLIAKWRMDLEVTRYMVVLQFPTSAQQHEVWLEKAATNRMRWCGRSSTRLTTRLLGSTGREDLVAP